MPYNTFIFDFDYTLADASKGIIGSVNYALGKLNIAPKDVEEIRRTVGMTLEATFAVLTGVDDPIKAALFCQYFIEKADEVMTLDTVLFDDTIPVLKNLKAHNCRAAIVTSKYNYRIMEVIEKYDIDGLVDYIVGFEDVKEAKPSPEGLLKAIAALAVPQCDVLFIGDSVIDAQTAENAEVDFAAVTTGATAASEFAPYPHILIASTLAELFHRLDD